MRIAVSIAADGTIAYRQEPAARRQLTWFDRHGARIGTIGPADSTVAAPALSPDGQRAAVTRAIDGNQDIWIIDSARTRRVWITKLTW